MQLPDGGVSLAGEEPWQGIDAMMASAAVTPESIAGVLDEASAIAAALAVPNIPEIGMTAAMAPDTGSQISIHNSKSLLKDVMRIGQDYPEKVPRCGKNFFARLSQHPHASPPPAASRSAAVESSQNLTQE